VEKLVDAGVALFLHRASVAAALHRRVESPLYSSMGRVGGGRPWADLCRSGTGGGGGRWSEESEVGRGGRRGRGVERIPEAKTRGWKVCWSRYSGHRFLIFVRRRACY
jgi:hypothetical protein